MGKTEGETQLRRHKLTWEGIIMTELRKVDWINLAQYRDTWPAVLNTVILFVLYRVWEIS